ICPFVMDKVSTKRSPITSVSRASADACPLQTMPRPSTRGSPVQTKPPLRARRARSLEEVTPRAVVHQVIDEELQRLRRHHFAIKEKRSKRICKRRSSSK